MNFNYVYQLKADAAFTYAYAPSQNRAQPKEYGKVDQDAPAKEPRYDTSTFSGPATSMQRLTYSPSDFSNPKAAERFNSDKGITSIKDIIASMEAEQARRASVEPIAVTVYGNTASIKLFDAIDAKWNSLHDEYIRDEFNERTQAGEDGADVYRDIIEKNPALKEFQALRESLLKADENGKNAIHEIGEMLTAGVNATVDMPDATIEERAMQREATLRMAAEIADKFGFSAEDKENLVSELSREAEKDAAFDTGMVKASGDKGQDVEFVNTPQNSWADFLNENLTDEAKAQLDEAYKPGDHIDANGNLVLREIDWGKLDENKQDLERVLFFISYNDYGMKQEMYEYANKQVNGGINDNVKANFDTMISDDKFSAVSQWQNDAREYIQQFSD